jgi:glycosyltransferase involved in cell wall biosynthesis
MRMLKSKSSIGIVVLLEPTASFQGYESKYKPLLIKYMNPDDYEISVIGSEVGLGPFSTLGVKQRPISVNLKSSSGISLVIGYALYLTAAFFTLLKETKQNLAPILMSLGGHTYSGLLVTIVSKLVRRKSIVRFAGPTRDTLRIRYKLGFLYSTIAKKIEDWVFPRCDIIISNSPLTNYSDNQDVQIEVISQGVNVEEFKHQSHPEQPKESPRLITVARLSKEKRISNLIKSLSNLSQKYQNIHLDIVGEGPARENLVSIARNLGLFDRIKFHGYIVQSEIPSLLSACDIFVLPSAKESLPSAMLEAMACRIPAIVAKEWITNLPDFENEKNVLSCNGSPESIAEAVIKILDNESLRKRLIRNAFQTIQQQHSLAAARLKFRNVVDSLMSISEKR